MKARKVWLEALVVGLMAVPLAARGLSALLTHHAWISGRNSAPHEYIGRSADYIGLGFLGLSLIVIAGWMLSYPHWRKAGIALLLLSMILAGGAFLKSFMA